jgi:hypothetical protein
MQNLNNWLLEEFLIFKSIPIRWHLILLAVGLLSGFAFLGLFKILIPF